MIALTARHTSHLTQLQVGDGQCGCTLVLVQFPHAPGNRSSAAFPASAIVRLADERWFVQRWAAHAFWY